MKPSIGTEVYWVYDGDVIKAKIVDFDAYNVKIRTPDGSQFGKLRAIEYDADMYEIWHSDIAYTNEEAIEKVKRGIRITRATMEAWRNSLDDLIGEQQL